MNSRPGALYFAEEPECKNAHRETYDRYDHPELGKSGQNIQVVCYLQKKQQQSGLHNRKKTHQSTAEQNYY